VGILEPRISFDDFFLSLKQRAIAFKIKIISAQIYCGIQLRLTSTFFRCHLSFLAPLLHPTHIPTHILTHPDGSLSLVGGKEMHGAFSLSLRISLALLC